MSRPLCPILLTLSAVFPSAALALGLGDLHVESALGQNFAAHIDLIDASPDDLARLSAAIADDDTFARHQLVRPWFLIGMTVAVGMDAQGRPVLQLRSTESFTEPLVTFLVDVRWRGGELIREYSAFLDPAELASNAPDTDQPTRATSTSALVPQGTPPTASAPMTAPVTPAIASAPATPATASAVAAPTPVASSTPNTPVSQRARVTPLPRRTATTPDHKSQLRSYTVAPGDTLARIASIAGARSGTQRHRMMIAIYRANPAAFQTNLNALHSRTVLRIPTSEELAAISPAEAERDYKAQLAAWRGMGARRLHTRHPAKASMAAIPNSAVDTKPDARSVEAERLALTRRVESLEESLQTVRRELQQRTQEAALSVRAAQTPALATLATGIESSHAGTPPWYRRVPFSALLGGLFMMLATGLWRRFRRRNADDSLVVHQAAPNSSAAEEPAPQEPLAGDDSIAVQADVVSPVPAAAIAQPEPAQQIDTGATTAILGPEIEAPGDTVEHKFSFYNPESHAHTTHVVVGSELTRSLAFVERRKNPAVVLQQAIEREPSRSDLHVKLLELYYATASENRLAFLEAARQVMQRKDLLSAEDWARITDMGRRIAPDDELFASALDDQAVA